MIAATFEAAVRDGPDVGKIAVPGDVIAITSHAESKHGLVGYRMEMGKRC
jgi:hypothetical protein